MTFHIVSYNPEKGEVGEVLVHSKCKRPVEKGNKYQDKGQTYFCKECDKWITMTNAEWKRI